jgi:hypothetical protein
MEGDPFEAGDLLAVEDVGDEGFVEVRDGQHD